jgi:hypothetical protein
MIDVYHVKTERVHAKKDDGKGSIDLGGQRVCLAWQAEMLASEAEALIDKLKCCGNCKHNFDADEENCQSCFEPKLERWEMK